MDSGSTAEIRLNGSKILHEHCTFENVDGVVTVVPKENAAVMINGIRIDKPSRLRSGFRVILGDFHIFRFNHPEEARAERAGSPEARCGIDPVDSAVVRPGHERTASSVGRVELDSTATTLARKCRLNQKPPTPIGRLLGGKPLELC